MAAVARRDLLRQVGLRSATALVVANIVGSGIFTTTGFQAADLGHSGLIYLLWIVGGVLALCGALCYAELGAAMPQAGAEYVYLREAYGRPLAFMSAFVSLVAGFSAAIAAALKSLARYLTHFFSSLEPDEPWFLGLSQGDGLAVILVWLLVLLHGAGVRRGVAASDWLTLLKVVGIALFVVTGLALGKGAVAGLTDVTIVYDSLRAQGGLAPAIATSLIFVMFCYTGFNAAAYVAGEMKTPQRDLPRSLLYGTGVVVLLYLGLNATYLYAVGLEGLAGEVEVGLIAARGLFGGLGVTLVAAVICVSILASASAMTIAGPRVYYAFGRDYPPLQWLASVGGRGGAPLAAMVVQGVVTSLVIVTGRVDQIQQYAGFTLTLFGSLAVSCVIVLRFRRPDLERPFRAWGYPVTPLLFLGASGWMMIWAFRGRPVESSLSLLTVAVGGLLFLLFGRRESSRGSRETDRQ